MNSEIHGPRMLENNARYFMHPRVVYMETKPLDLHIAILYVYKCKISKL